MKRKKPICGIYKISSKTKKNIFYIGASRNVLSRWSTHKGKLRDGEHSNCNMQEHADVYGVDDLQIRLVRRCSERELSDMERYFISVLNPSLNLNNKNEVGLYNDYYNFKTIRSHAI